MAGPRVSIITPQSTAGTLLGASLQITVAEDFGDSQQSTDATISSGTTVNVPYESTQQAPQPQTIIDTTVASLQAINAATYAAMFP